MLPVGWRPLQILLVVITEASEGLSGQGLVLSHLQDGDFHDVVRVAVEDVYPVTLDHLLRVVLVRVEPVAEVGLGDLIHLAVLPALDPLDPALHLAKFEGILQADAFAGFNKLYQSGAIQEAPCPAHIRRNFFDLMKAHQSPIATEAVERIAALYRIEKEIKGNSANELRAMGLVLESCRRRCKFTGSTANAWRAKHPVLPPAREEKKSK